jgi:hypothetical protein
VNLPSGSCGGAGVPARSAKNHRFEKVLSPFLASWTRRGSHASSMPVPVRYSADARRRECTERRVILVRLAMTPRRRGAVRAARPGQAAWDGLAAVHSCGWAERKRPPGRRLALQRCPPQFLSGQATPARRGDSGADAMAARRMQPRALVRNFRVPVGRGAGHKPPPCRTEYFSAALEREQVAVNCAAVAGVWACICAAATAKSATILIGRARNVLDQQAPSRSTRCGPSRLTQPSVAIGSAAWRVCVKSR